MKEQNPEFCTGVQIILKRMESNPEEFNVSSGNYGKWGRILEQLVIAKEAGSDKLPFPNHLSGLTAAEQNAIYDGYCKFLRKRFDDYVMREILAEARELSSPMTSAPNVVLGNSGLGGSALVSSGAGPGTTWASFPNTSYAVTLNIGNTSISEEELETIKRRVL